KAIQFLEKLGLNELDSKRILNAESRDAINADYQNQIYFVLARMDANEFDRFLKANAFTRDEFSGFPRRGGDRPGIPSWWDPPGTQVERYSIKRGALRPFVTVLWEGGRLYL